MSKLLDVPVFLEASSKRELVHKMVEMNTKARFEFKYFDIQQQHDKKWVAWFYVDGVIHAALIRSIIEDKKVVKRAPKKVEK